MDKEYREDELLKVYDVDASIYFTQAVINGVIYSVPKKTLITCKLEDGRTFKLYSVPIDIVLVIRKIKGMDLDNEYDLKDDRETIFDIIASIPRALEEIGKHLRKIVIDSINPDTYTYAATAEFGIDNTVIKRRMIPSHAILLALLTHRPIYVRKILVDQQEEIEAMEEELDELGFSDEEEFDEPYY